MSKNPFWFSLQGFNPRPPTSWRNLIVSTKWSSISVDHILQHRHCLIDSIDVNYPELQKHKEQCRISRVTEIDNGIDRVIDAFISIVARLTNK